MKRIILVLGSQEINCNVRLNDNGIYVGDLLESLEDKLAIKFWKEYEDAVNSIMLHEIDVLEQKMEKYNFKIIIGDDEYLGSEVDLQIYPSELKMSFRIGD